MQLSEIRRIILQDLKINEWELCTKWEENGEITNIPETINALDGQLDRCLPVTWPSFQYLAPSITPYILSSFPVPADEKQPHRMMLPPPHFTGSGGCFGGDATVIAFSLMATKFSFSLVWPFSLTFFHMLFQTLGPVRAAAHTYILRSSDMNTTHSWTLCQFWS